MKGSTPFLNSRTCTPFFDASMAHQITTASRASSDGWKLSGPMSTHRRAPLSEGAMSRVNGSSGIEQQKPMVTSSSGQASCASDSSPAARPRAAAAPPSDRAGQLAQPRSRGPRSRPCTVTRLAAP